MRKRDRGGHVALGYRRRYERDGDGRPRLAGLELHPSEVAIARRLWTLSAENYSCREIERILAQHYGHLGVSRSTVSRTLRDPIYRRPPSEELRIVDRATIERALRKLERRKGGARIITDPVGSRSAISRS
jgi:hypothetical protein